MRVMQWNAMNASNKVRRGQTHPHSHPEFAESSGCMGPSVLRLHRHPPGHAQCIFSMFLVCYYHPAPAPGQVCCAELMPTLQHGSLLDVVDVG